MYGYYICLLFPQCVIFKVVFLPLQWVRLNQEHWVGNCPSAKPAFTDGTRGVLECISWCSGLQKQNKPRGKAGEDRQSEDTETFWNSASVSEQGLLGSWESLLVLPGSAGLVRGPSLAVVAPALGHRDNPKTKHGVGWDFPVLCWHAHVVEEAQEFRSSSKVNKYF